MLKPTEREQTRVISFRLRPATISLLKELSASHGGVGRAIQIATDLLWAHKWARMKPITLKEGCDDKPQQLFSFAALPRTEQIIEQLSEAYYGGQRTGPGQVNSEPVSPSLGMAATRDSEAGK